MVMSCIVPKVMLSLYWSSCWFTLLFL